MIRFLLLTSTILLYFAFKVPSPLRRTRPSADYLLLFARKKSAEVATSARAGRTLVIVESPAKAKTIQGFLDERQFVVDSCQGHVRDLPRAGKDAPPEFKGQYISQELGLKVADLGVQVHNNFEPIYTPLAAKGDIIKRLQVKAKKCDSILLATDEDREGEAISWHILELLQPSIPCERAVFHEITKDAILEAFDSPRTVDMNLVQSQETRRMLDRLTGYTLSPMLWRYLARGLSAGRVQSCGLYLLVEVSECMHCAIRHIGILLH
jgi:DNA topoisomerase-1